MPGLKRKGAFYGRPATKVQKVETVTPEASDVLELQARTKRLASEVRYLKDSVESKYHDEFGPRFVVDNSINNVSVLVDPAQGSTTVTRDGDEIRPTHLELILTAEFNSAATGSTHQCVRMMVIQAKEGFVPSSITATPSNSSVFSQGGTAHALWSPYDANNRKHYTILEDKIITMDPYNVVQAFRKTYPLKRKIRYAESGSITAERGQIYLVFTSTETTTGPKVQWYTRAHFKDM